MLQATTVVLFTSVKVDSKPVEIKYATCTSGVAQPADPQTFPGARVLNDTELTLSKGDSLVVDDMRLSVAKFCCC